MDFLPFLLLSLAVSRVSLLPPPRIKDADGERKDIPEINKDLNLWEGDIMLGSSGQRSAILGDKYRWNGYVPYVLNNTLSVNDKGVILRAFEQLRLRACLDFKPRTTEVDYVSVGSLTGCWSSVGKQGGHQQLSIGVGCGYIATVEHEFLHALGFNHEQSRYDRDDYVTIIFENIDPDKSYNYNKLPEAESTTQGTSYDYTSVMHYGQYAFSNGTGRTIITKDTRFQDLIGQRYELSPTDALELSKLYKCSSSISFLDHCSFDDNSMCRMVTCSSTANTWKMASNVSGGPFSDHSNLKSIDVPALSMNTTSSGPSSFMYFSTETGQEGNSGQLVSKEMNPRRDCKAQCLQFSYYHSGNETDQLNIWIREYNTYSDTIGTLRLMDQITGPPTNHWQLRNVPLNANKAFLVEFEGRKGAGSSGGGFSVDDINLSESECPQNVWQIQNFMELWNKSAPGTYLHSPLYYSPDGYRYQVSLQLGSSYIFVSMRLASGVNDDQLQWPCPWRQVTYLLLDQNPNIQNSMSSQGSITTNPDELWGEQFWWGKPSEVGTPVVTDDNTTVNVTASKTFNGPLQKARLSDREFIKGGDLILLISMQDISALKQSDSLPCPKVPAKNFNVSLYQGAQERSCVPRVFSGATVHSSATFLLALILLVLLLIN